MNVGCRSLRGHRYYNSDAYAVKVYQFVLKYIALHVDCTAEDAGV